MNLPHFKYSPNAYDLNIIVKRAIICECCNKPREYAYEISLYSAYDLNDICPWCVLDGLAAKKFNAELNPKENIIRIEECTNKDDLDEVIYRTPSYHAWQDPLWVVHCNDPCAFIGYPEIDEFKEKVLDNLILDPVDWCYFSNIDDLIKEVENGYLWLYLFKCLHCHKYKISVDYD